MKYSGVGGQAVMEGVMMKNQDRYAVAVRKPDHKIDVKVENYKSTIKNEKIRHLPIVRGVVNFVESLILGMSTLMYSASFFEDEEDYLIELQDNGVGFETLTYGYGLKQMMERISILGGQLQFESRDGFFTRISLPKYKEGR